MNNHSHPDKNPHIFHLLQHAADQQASDLHLSAGSPPWLRIQGELHTLDALPLNTEEIQILIAPLLNAAQRSALEQKLEIDFAYALSQQLRCRANIYHQQRGLSAAFRLIPTTLPTLEKLGLPSIFKDFCRYEQGLILITGQTGSGKSTTLAAMMNHINHSACKHIITIEDPIEFIYTNQKSLIHQREVHDATPSFHHALRAALRQDPDIILVGELRDLDTIRLALTAAETGHLVLSTLHTASAPKTIDRIIDVFPGNEKETVRIQLAESLAVVVSQKLFSQNGVFRAAFEILICTPAIRNMIRDNKTAQIYSAMQAGQGVGMCTMEQYVQAMNLTK